MRANGWSLLLLLAATTAQAGYPWPGCNNCGCQDKHCASSCLCPRVFGHAHEPPPSTWDGSYWGFCQPRSRNLHLWDGYCEATSPCPCCGFDQGGMFCHTFCKKRCLTKGQCLGPTLADPQSIDEESFSPSDDQPKAAVPSRVKTKSFAPAKAPYYQPNPPPRPVNHRR